MKHVIVIVVVLFCHAMAIGVQTIVEDGSGRTFRVYGEKEAPQKYLSASTPNYNIRPRTFTREEVEEYWSGKRTSSISQQIDEVVSAVWKTISEKMPAVVPVLMKVGLILVAICLILVALCLFGVTKTAVIVIVASGLFLIFGDGGCSRDGVKSDASSLYVVCAGEGYVDGSVQSVNMVARWKNGKYELYVDFGKDIFLRGIKGCVCGPCSDWKIRTHNCAKWSASTNGEAVFYDGNVPALLNELRRENQFEVFVGLKDGRGCLARFDNFRDKIQGLISKAE